MARSSCIRWLRVPDVVWQPLEPHVAEARAEGREQIFLFCRDWVRRHTHRQCREVFAELVAEQGAQAEADDAQADRDNRQPLRGNSCPPKSATLTTSRTPAIY